MQFQLQILFSALWFFVAFLSSLLRWQLNIHIPLNLTFTITGHFVIQMAKINQLHKAKSFLLKLKGVQIVAEFSTFN